MISTDFAANEEWSDCRLALRLMVQPWSWQKGKSIETLKKYIERNFFPKHQLTFFYTGRAALYFLLQALKLPENSEIIIQAFTCEAVILPITAQQLIPVYVDIDENNYSMNQADLEKKITFKSKVIILQHTFGILPDREKIIEIAKKNKLFVIEDLAHGFDEKSFKNDRSKTTKLLSFGRSKAFSSVFGGAIATTDSKIAHKLKRISTGIPFPGFRAIYQCLLYKQWTVPIKLTYDIFLGKALHKTINLLKLLPGEISNKEKNGLFDSAMAKSYPNALAQLALHQLKKLKKTNARRRKAVKIYSEIFHSSSKGRLASGQNLRPLTSNLVLIRFPLLVSNRRELLSYAKKHNIFLGKWYDQVVAPKGISLKKMMYTPGSCPKAEEICEKIINLPTNVTEKEAKKVIEILKSEIN